MLRLSASGLRRICFRKAPANVMYPRPVELSRYAAAARSLFTYLIFISVLTTCSDCS
jgi:hypothetical protein